jgi:hypothetical protein
LDQLQAFHEEVEAAAAAAAQDQQEALAKALQPAEPQTRGSGGYELTRERGEGNVHQEQQQGEQQHGEQLNQAKTPAAAGGGGGGGVLGPSQTQVPQVAAGPEAPVGQTAAAKTRFEVRGSQQHAIGPVYSVDAISMHVLMFCRSFLQLCLSLPFLHLLTGWLSRS